MNADPFAGRFANDHAGFEEAFARACAASLGGKRRRGLAARAFGKAKRALQRAGEVLADGAERVAVRRGVEWARGGWVHVAPSDVWRFDTGGGKRILGIAGEVGKESRVVVLSPMEKGQRDVSFREVLPNVGVMRVESGDWKSVEELMMSAKGWIFVTPLQYVQWLETGHAKGDKQLAYDAHDQFVDGYRVWGIGEAELEADEHRLLADADRIWFCTEADRDATRRRYTDEDGSKWKILPNGIHESELGVSVVPSEARKRRESVGWKRPVVLFAGTNYGPNYEAVDEISRDWAPKYPDVTFVVLGMRMDRYLRDGGWQPAPNVVFTGLVSEEEKRILYDLAEVAIMPLKTGTGSSLKVPEAIARGKVVIGTRIALRGFEEWTKWGNIIECEHGEGVFGEVLAQLKENPKVYDMACSGAAEEMQSRYTWSAVMKAWKGSW